MRFTTLPLFLLPLLATSQLLSSQPTDPPSQATDSSSQTTTSNPPPTTPPSLELRAQPPAPAPAPVVPAVPVPPVPPAPNAPAGGAGGGAGGAELGYTQVPTISTVTMDTVIGGVPTQKTVVFTQTFASIVSQGPTPERGTIGLGTLTATKTGKEKRWWR